MLTIFLTVIAISFFSAEFRHEPQDSSLNIIQEDFANLENWEEFSFSGNKNPTEYIVQKDSSNIYLKIISQNSASGLIYKDDYNPNEYPILTWRWRADNILTGADGKVKSGDDYAIRIFVMFDDDSVETSFWTSIRNSTIKLLYGTKPPESSFCFVWTNIEYDEKYFESPYSETVKIIPMEMGDDRLKKWCNYKVNIVTLFKEIFERSCPNSAKIALMSDTDNTESNTVATIDYISVSKD
jgi:hypothetical protein